MIVAAHGRRPYRRPLNQHLRYRIRSRSSVGAVLISGRVVSATYAIVVCHDESDTCSVAHAHNHGLARGRSASSPRACRPECRDGRARATLARATRVGRIALPGGRPRPARVARPSEFAHSPPTASAASRRASTPASAPSTKAPSKTSKTTKAPPRRSASPACTATRRARCSPIRRCSRTSTSPAPACTRANRTPTCGRSRKRWRRPSASPTSPARRPAQASTALARTSGAPVGLRKYWATPYPGRGPRPPPANSLKAKKPAKAPNPPKRLASRPRRCRRSTARWCRPAAPATTTTTSGSGSSCCASTNCATKRLLLEKAEQIMAFVMAGWENNPKLACPGGVPFSDAPSNTDRNTVTDGPAAELGVQLYRVTGKPVYLQFAQQAYQWVRDCLTRAGRTVRRPHSSARRDRPHRVELQPGRDDRRRTPALPGDRQQRISLPGAPDRQGGAGLLHAPATARAKTHSSRRSTSGT